MLAGEEPDNPGLKEIADALAKKIWQAQGMPKTIDKNMVLGFADKLWQAVVEGYGEDLIGIDYDTPDANMLRNLQTDVYSFSAAKNWQQMKELTLALLDDDNKLRSFSAFKKEAFKINDAHVKSWLAAEYDTAVAGAQMAGKWVNIAADKTTLPLLEFDAIIDGRTSEICRGLDKTLLPIDDPFWDVWYPPNHWRCRSSVRQKSGGVLTDTETIVYPDKIPDMFKTNLAKKGLVFPESHPYWNGIPAAEIEKALKLIPKTKPKK